MANSKRKPAKRKGRERPSNSNKPRAFVPSRGSVSRKTRESKTYVQDSSQADKVLTTLGRMELPSNNYVSERIVSRVSGKCRLFCNQPAAVIARHLPVDRLRDQIVKQLVMRLLDECPSAFETGVEGTKQDLLRSLGAPSSMAQEPR